MNVLVTKNQNGTLTVNVSIDPVNNKGVEEFVNTKVIKNYLNGKKIKYGNCLQSAIIANTSKKLVGEWVFENPIAKSKKIVDTPPSPVVSSKKVNKKDSKDKEKSD